jgi:acyl carrier protein
MTVARTIPNITTQEIEECIRSFLDQEADIESGIGIHKNPLRPAVDSLVIVEVLVEVEALVDCDLPLSLIRKGGYYSVDDVIADLLPRIIKSVNAP